MSSDGPSDSPPTRRPARARRSPLIVVLDALSSVWLGVWTLGFLFVFMSVGSAGYVVRQSRWLEMTEFEWFHWWPFNAAVALLCVNLVVTTIRRIPFRVVNLGVWMIHTGIILLSIGSVIYFVRKIEGDTPVFRRHVVIERAGEGPAEARRVTLVAAPGARAIEGDGPDAISYEVVEVRPDWPILTGENAGKRTLAVSVAVTPAGQSQPRFIRQLLDGFPQYTEDILPGQGRAVRATGKALVDEDVSMSLAFERQEWFYIVNSWALYAREVGSQTTVSDGWVPRPIRGLPRYNDYIASTDDVWLSLPGPDEEALRPDPIDILVAPASPGDPLAGVDVRVTAYLRYAVPQTRWVEGAPGAPLNPVARVRLQAASGQSKEHELVALDPSRASAELGELSLRIAETPEDLARLALPSAGEIVVRIASLGAELRMPPPAQPPGADAPFMDIPGAPGYGLRIRQMEDNLHMMGGVVISVAVVDVRRPDGMVIARFVADQAGFTREYDPDNPESTLRDPDPAIETLYTPNRPSPRVTLVTGAAIGPPGSLAALLGSPTGEPTRVEVRPGQTLSLEGGVTVRVVDFLPAAVEQTRPAVVPEFQRDRDAGAAFTMVRVEVGSGPNRQVHWLPFHQYTFPDESYMYGGKFRHEPALVTLPDGREVEIVFGRERRRLPAPVVLEDFRLIAHIGGFTGEMPSIRDWESVLRFVTPEGLSEPVTIATNDPAQFAGLRYFQAMWDPPTQPRFEGDPGNAGLNFTGLGVGNREGVVTQLAGCALMTVGMLYAFYVKPIIKRRREDRVRRDVASGVYGERASSRVRRPDAEPALVTEEAAP